MKAQRPVKKNQEEIEFYKKHAPLFGAGLYQLYQQLTSGKISNSSHLEAAFKALWTAEESWEPWTLEFPFSDQTNMHEEQFGHAICIASDDIIAHGRPNDNLFKPGQVISVDCGLARRYSKNRYLHFDAGFTFVHEDIQTWAYTPQIALQRVVESQPKTVNETCEIIRQTAKDYNLDVVVSLAGHGIGYNLHEAPLIHNAVGKYPDISLFEGLVFCVEPIFVLPGKDRGGSHIAKTCIDSNGWSVRTIDGRPGSHFESMFCISEGKLVDLTKVSEWEL